MKRVCLFVLFLVSLAAEDLRVFPPALQKGDLVALVFPAFFLDKEAAEAQAVVQQKADWLASQGYRTIFYPEQVHMYGYFAGTDSERAEALMNAWRNPEVKAIWCFRGGYGAGRILDLLDYEWIAAHPKIFIGMSDIALLHAAIQKHAGLVTFLVPVLNYFGRLDSSFDAAYAFSELEKVIVEGRQGEFSLPDGQQLQVIVPGVAQGVVVGGNLSVLAASCGTKWQLDTDGKILFLEDVGEKVYRIDRLLWQLKEAGLLEKPAGVILGSWEDCENNLTRGFSLEEVLFEHFGHANYPVICGFPSGHGDYQTSLPLNAYVELNTETKSISLLEQAVQ